MKPTQESLDIMRKISETVPAPHHHQHILLDIAKSYPDDQEIKYLEIGCLNGSSACLMLQRPKTEVITIDIGVPVDPMIAVANMESHNNHKNKFYYVRGYSHSPAVLDVIKEIGVIDILFIDGDHSYSAVINDFNIYKDFIRPGGYIVFDDYNHPACPDVKKAVNDLVGKASIDFEIIGTLDNTLGAWRESEENNTGNCFIIRRY